MTHTKQFLILAGAIVLSCSSALHAADARDCRDIEDNAKRLACYDRLSTPSPVQVEEPRAQEAPAPVPEAVPKANSETPPAVAAPVAKERATPVLDDDVGSERLDRDEPEAVAVVGHVSSCGEGPRGKYHFYFDNGQVWQQRDNKAVRWSECDFDVSIEKDFFGYKMTPQGEQRSIRISRIK